MTQLVILAGGLGSRLSEETYLKPKPLVEVGGLPIIWHIMKIYSYYGIKEFIICGGYKVEKLKEYFVNLNMFSSDFTIYPSGEIRYHNKPDEDWVISVINTGVDTQTGGRLKRVGDYIHKDTFYFTYGDGVGNIDIQALTEFHHNHGKKATVTGALPNARFGALELDGTTVKDFKEKPLEKNGWVNAGFFILNKEVIDLIDDDTTVWERKPMEWLANNCQMEAFLHSGFWHPMDTLRDKNYLEDLWVNGKAPWKLWD